MPVDHAKAKEQYNRYTYARDNGHIAYVQKDRKCSEFLKGNQWDVKLAQMLAQQRRPALTINKIFSTFVTALGEHLNNRVDISCKPAGGEADEEVARVLDKVFLHILRQNQYQWVEADMFAYAMVGSRSYIDLRVSFDDRMQADIEITRVHGRNVLLDPDATEYDPDTWKDVQVTKWLTADEIEDLYGKSDADLVRTRMIEGSSVSGFESYDSIDGENPGAFGGDGPRRTESTSRDQEYTYKRVRVLERQYRVTKRVPHFVDLQTGDSSVIPSDWPKPKVNRIAKAVNAAVVKKEAEVIHWRVTADEIVLHDEVSPYKHFTIIPFFPILHDGETMGMIEHLLSLQEQLNKAESQMLHIVNTTSNSGWKTKRGNVKNMSQEEFEQRGAETGLVLEVEDVQQTEKITPNTIPTGIEVVSRKADEYLKEVSGFSDSMRGFDRADVAAKAIQYKQKAGSSSTAKFFDNLNRTRHILARNMLDLIQEFYTEERIIRIVGEAVDAAPSEEIEVNKVTPEGQVVNDLTIGKYDVVITSVPPRDTFEQTQLQEAIQLRELQVRIPDSVMIKHSSLSDKRELLDQMNQPPSPEEQRLLELDIAEREAEIRAKDAQTQERQVNALLKQVSAKKMMLEAKRAALNEADIPSELESAEFERLVKLAELDDSDRALTIQEEQLKQQQRDLKGSGGEDPKPKPKDGKSEKVAPKKGSNAQRLAGLLP